jgi:hypothetical protein
MWSVRKLFGFILIAGFLAGCSAGSGDTAESPSYIVLGGGPITVTSHKFTPPGKYPWDIIVIVTPTPPSTGPQDSGSGAVVVGEDNPPPSEPETPPENAGQVMVTGSLVHSGYAEGNFLVEARPGTPCGDAVCADLSAKPFASVKVVKPGYFALVMPKVESEVFVVATYSHPTDGTSTREQSLGVVSERVNGIVLDFSPDEPAPPSVEEPTIPPDVAESIGDLFERAQDAMDSLNDMMPDFSDFI